MLQAAFGSHGFLSLSGLTRSAKLSYILEVWRAGFEPATTLFSIARFTLGVTAHLRGLNALSSYTERALTGLSYLHKR